MIRPRMPHELTRVPQRLSGVQGSDPNSAKCLAHDDQSPSLSIGLGDDGRVLFDCHAGCRVDSILAKLRLTASDVPPAVGSFFAARCSASRRARFDGSSPMGASALAAPHAVAPAES